MAVTPHPAADDNDNLKTQFCRDQSHTLPLVLENTCILDLAVWKQWTSHELEVSLETKLIFLHHVEETAGLESPAWSPMAVLLKHSTKILGTVEIHPLMTENKINQINIKQGETF